MPSLPRAWTTWLQEHLITDWRYKLSALGAALLIWAYVAGQQSMQVMYTVPVQFQNLPAGMKLLAPKVKTAEVTLAARRDVILSLNRRQIAVSLDLSGMRLGRNQYLISSRDVIVPAGIDVKDVSPRQLSIQLGPEIQTP
jgi:YbbR domain-containing protein